jgi:hypothetical protein
MSRQFPEANRQIALLEVVQVLGILCTGVWALVVFGFTQYFKPAHEPPSLSLSGSLEKLGEHNGFVQLGYKLRIRNTGGTDAFIIADAITASAFNYDEIAKPFGELANPKSDYALYGQMDQVAIYRRVYVTKYADPTHQGGLHISAGEEYPIVGSFLVESGVYDAVALYGSVAYVKSATPGSYPTKVTFLDGDRTLNVILFVGPPGDKNYRSLLMRVDQISLWQNSPARSSVERQHAPSLESPQRVRSSRQDLSKATR